MIEILVEIRAAEGGDDAKMLVRDQVSIYERVCSKNNLTLKEIEVSSSMTTLLISGKNPNKIFMNESGGHRWQRIPPNEARGRVHTSTITVAVMEKLIIEQFDINKKDVKETFTRGTGPGGQHKNKTDTCVVLKHIPTGISVRCDVERSQAANRELAWDILRSRVGYLDGQAFLNGYNMDRRTKIGSGMRGDKRRTIRAQDGTVTDHILNKKWNYKKYIRGDW